MTEEIDNTEHYAKSAGGLFDIRNVIGALMGIYGLILLITGIVNHSTADTAKAGSNVNLWAGIALLAVCVGFVSWALWRPVRVTTG